MPWALLVILPGVDSRWGGPRYGETLRRPVSRLLGNRAQLRGKPLPSVATAPRVEHAVVTPSEAATAPAGARPLVGDALLQGEQAKCRNACCVAVEAEHPLVVVNQAGRTMLELAERERAVPFKVCVRVQVGNEQSLDVAPEGFWTQQYVADPGGGAKAE